MQRDAFEANLRLFVSTNIQAIKQFLQFLSYEGPID